MSNEVVLIDQFVESAQNSRDTPLPGDVAFEVFAAATILGAHNLSEDEAAAGRIGGGLDGGIDAAYTFLDGQLLDEDNDLFADGFNARHQIRKGAELSLWLVQAKRSESFGEDAFDKVRASTEKLFNLRYPDDKLSTLYSSDAIARLRLFTRAWFVLAVRSPRISITFAYVTRGDTNSISQGVKQKQADLSAHFRELVPGSNVDVRVVGARELWALASATPEYDLQLKFRDYISEGDSYAGLVALPDFFRFISEESGALHGHLFDWNVRDFQGAVTVNQQIKTSLETNDSQDFWWLNNGITILCSEVNIGGDKTFTLEGVQIVNGMQTSHAIHDVLTNTGEDLDWHRRRSVHVRVIKTLDDTTRDRVIRATNSQTKVPDASLHATEDLHRQIEAHFAARGWYYDRRKNYYKNQGKPSDRIISIPTLGQAVMAIGLGRADDARARPSTLLNSEADYTAVFNPKLNLDIYLWIATVQRRVDSLLLSDSVDADASVRTNTKFLISSYLVTAAVGSRIYNPNQLSSISNVPLKIDASDVQEALEIVRGELEAVALENNWQLDRAAKSRPLTENVITRAVTTSNMADKSTPLDS